MMRAGQVPGQSGKHVEELSFGAAEKIEVSINALLEEFELLVIVFEPLAKDDGTDDIGHSITQQMVWIEGRISVFTEGFDQKPGFFL
uniref:Uncharacterized protein n=1 Tax=Anguilla anguilla TaxID=7936 RepID=A0A0E9XF28_ANGAN